MNVNLIKKVGEGAQSTEDFEVCNFDVGLDPVHSLHPLRPPWFVHVMA